MTRPRLVAAAVDARRTARGVRAALSRAAELFLLLRAPAPGRAARGDAGPLRHLLAVLNAQPPPQSPRPVVGGRAAGAGWRVDAATRRYAAGLAGRLEYALGATPSVYQHGGQAATLDDVVAHYPPHGGALTRDRAAAADTDTTAAGGGAHARDAARAALLLRPSAELREIAAHRGADTAACAGKAAVVDAILSPPTTHPRAAAPLAAATVWSCSPVLPLLHLGNQQAARDPALLLSLNIGHVASVCGITPDPADGVVVHHVDVDDDEGADLAAHLDGIVRFVHAGRSAGRGVLVHCRAGFSRSAAAVAAYLMHRCWGTLVMAWLGWARGRALAYVASCRTVCPNRGFVRQLDEWTPRAAEMHRELAGRRGIPRCRCPQQEEQLRGSGERCAHAARGAPR
eukprot:gene27285-29975_t